MKLAISFTNLGPYHVARLRALAGGAEGREGVELLAVETAGAELRYPWETTSGEEPFRAGHLVSRGGARVVVGRGVPGSDAAGTGGGGAGGGGGVWLRAAGVPGGGGVGAKRRVPAVLMSESQAIDRPRVWWKEAVKRRRVARFDAALVGGKRHLDYLVELGMKPEMVTMGYNAVDHEFFERRADELRASGEAACADARATVFFERLPVRGGEKPGSAGEGLREYRERVGAESRLEPGALRGGAAGRGDRRAVPGTLGVGDSVFRPGFMQQEGLDRWYAFASAFVLSSRSEPWGLVANEAAACGLPLLLSNAVRVCGDSGAGAGGPDGVYLRPGGRAERLAQLMELLTLLPEESRRLMGQQSA